MPDDVLQFPDATPKAGQTIEHTDILGELTGQKKITASISDMLGVTDALKALRGEMTPEEAQGFFVSALPMLVAGPEARVAETVAEEVVPAAARGIKAFHASPHDFEKFDLSKIGTGEGAQVYGHGLYFAENPQVAEEYYKNFEGRHIPGAAAGKSKYLVGGEEMPPGISGHAAMDTAHEMELLLSLMHSNPDSSMIPYLKSNIERRIDTHYSMTAGGSAGDDMRAMADFYNRRVKNAEAGAVTQRAKPKRYEVNIKADPEHFLDYEAGFPRQSKHVQAALEKLGIREKAPNASGRSIYDMLGNKEFRKQIPPAELEGIYPEGMRDDVYEMPHVAAARTLKEAGIPGIRYLDQGSRNLEDLETELALTKRQRSAAIDAGITPETIAREFDEKIKWLTDKVENPTYNYVVFDDKLIDIVKKYGLAGVIGAGAAHHSDSGEHLQIDDHLQ